MYACDRYFLRDQSIALCQRLRGHCRCVLTMPSTAIPPVITIA
jgi:hypothetical protein